MSCSVALCGAYVLDLVAHRTRRIADQGQRSVPWFCSSPSAVLCLSLSLTLCLSLSLSFVRLRGRRPRARRTPRGARGTAPRARVATAPRPSWPRLNVHMATHTAPEHGSGTEKGVRRHGRRGRRREHTQIATARPRRASAAALDKREAMHGHADRKHPPSLSLTYTDAVPATRSHTFGREEARLRAAASPAHNQCQSQRRRL